MSQLVAGAVIALVVVLLVVAAVAVAVWLVDRADARRHQSLELKLEDMKRLTLQAINQRQRIEDRVDDHSEVLVHHAELLDHLRPTGKPARRPKS